MSKTKSVQLSIIGRVQGVGYRWFAQRIADALGVKGTVRNRYDGTVEVVAEGPEETLRAFIEQLRRGPLSSRVTEIEEAWGEASGKYSSFRITF